MDSLEHALNNLDLTSSSQSPDGTVRAAQLLADASKVDLQVRKGLGQPKPLQQLVALIDCSLNDSLETVEVALRCIGNACIDNDVARQNVIDLGFSWAQRCLMTGYEGDMATAILTSKVLYNVCMDFEPAQQQCFRERIHYQLIYLLSRKDMMGDDSLSLVIELFYWISSQRHVVTDAQTARPAVSPLSKIIQLPVQSAEHLALDDYTLLTGACTTLLRSPEFQEDLSEHGDEVWQLLVTNERCIEQAQHTASCDTEEDAKPLIGLSTDIIWSLSDLAAQPSVHAHYGLRDEWVQNLTRSIKLLILRRDEGRIFIGACQVIGNMLWSAKDTRGFPALDLLTIDESAGSNDPESFFLHAMILRAINTISETEALHSVAGLCLQLCRCIQIREAIAESATLESALVCLCRHENPQIKQDGMKLLRAIGQGNAAVQYRFAEVARQAMADAASAGASPIGDADVSMIEGPG